MNLCSHQAYAAILGRWQPVHLGHQAVLTALCERFERVVIGIGSSNIQDYRNPFLVTEVTEMLQLSLPTYTNYTLNPIPDQTRDQDWCRQVVNIFGRPEFFITANPWVKALLEQDYPVAAPVQFVPRPNHIAVSATMVRRNLAQGRGWRDLLPPPVAAYILDNGLDQRFRQQFGLHTLAMETIIQ